MNVPMRAITLHAPWATLLVTRQACDHDGTECIYNHPLDLPPMVKRFETRSWPCPPSIIGQRVAFHQGKLRPIEGEGIGRYLTTRRPDLTMLDGSPLPGRWFLCDWDAPDDVAPVPLPLGAVVGSGIVTASLPITTLGSVSGVDEPCVAHWDDGRLLYWPDRPGGPHGNDFVDITDQLPYGDWTPRRWAWQIEDAAPTTERCPACWGRGYHDTDDGIHTVPCPCCDRVGFCDPIPAVGRQGWWTWNGGAP